MDFSETRKPLTGIILLFETLPKLNVAQITGTIAHIEQLRQPAKLRIEVEEKGVLRAFIEFDDHRVQLVGLSTPVPDSTVKHTIPVSNWKSQDKTPLLGHKANIICWYEGTSANPTERLIALYKVAYSLYKVGLLGLLDEDAWNCMPRRAIEDQVKTATLKRCRETVPLGIWTGFVKIFKSQREVWFCTKGYHRFGVKDLAYLGNMGEADSVFTMFFDLFSYMRGGANLNVGETAQISASEYIRFREVYEYPDYLNSPLETLVLEKIKASEINKPIK